MCHPVNHSTLFSPFSETRWAPPYRVFLFSVSLVGIGQFEVEGDKTAENIYFWCSYKIIHCTDAMGLIQNSITATIVEEKMKPLNVELMTLAPVFPPP